MRRCEAQSWVFLVAEEGESSCTGGTQQCGEESTSVFGAKSWKTMGDKKDGSRVSYGGITAFSGRSGALERGAKTEERGGEGGNVFNFRDQRT